MLKKQKIVARELKYYEENSILSGIIPKGDDIKLADLEKKLSKIHGFKLEEYKFSDSYRGVVLKCEYKKERYELEIYPTEFDGASFPESYILQSYYFKKEEIEPIKESTLLLSVIMKFKSDPRKDYQLQLKVLYALVPSLVGVLDESAMKVLPPKYVKMVTESKYVMSPSDLYLVHAVYDKSNCVWLHTHGLNRCGATELEIVGANEDNSKWYYNIINAFASYIVENKKEGFDPLQHCANIGWFSDETPIILTCIPWVDAMGFYKRINLGGVKDRKLDHNGFTSIIFSYASIDDVKNNKIIKITDLNDKLDKDAILFYSNSETKRMSNVAKEQIRAVYNAFENKDNKVLLKIALKTTLGGNDYEHIWFKLLEIDNEKFKCELTQEAYNVKDIKVGDIRVFTIDDITDWAIYTKEGTINPNNAYIAVS